MLSSSEPRPAALRAFPPRGDDQTDLLENVPWHIYDRFVMWRGDAAGPKMVYLDGRLEIVSPGPYHEKKKSLIGRLLEAWCLDHDVEFTPFGEWTQRDATKRAGLEPDECYVFGEIEGTPARPHLAIEVNWTSGSIDKLEIYRRIGIEEVWIWQDSVLQIHLLIDDAFQVSLSSRHLPDLDVQILARFLDASTASKAMREYRAALAGVL